MTSIRPAEPADVSTIWRMILDLAEFEKLRDQVKGSEEELHQSLFSEKPVCHAVVAVSDGQTVGYALYFYNYSTFLTRKGLYLEDLYVAPEVRGQGIGKLLLNHIIELARDGGCKRVDWSVLDWNQNAIDFYESMGARVMPDWRTCRIEL